MVANRLRDAAAVLEVDSAYRRDAAIMREAADEVDRLRHDIERHVEIACELATECERLRAELAACQLALAKVGPYYIPATCVGDDEAKAVYAAIDTARKGEGDS